MIGLKKRRNTNETNTHRVSKNLLSWFVIIGVNGTISHHDKILCARMPDSTFYAQTISDICTPDSQGEILNLFDGAEKGLAVFFRTSL